MTPIWIFPAYPLLLVGPFAANLIDALPNYAAAAKINSMAIALGAVCIQGTGFLVSMMIYSAFIYRLMTQKLPRETTRPGMVGISLSPSKLLLTITVCVCGSIRLYCCRYCPSGEYRHPKNHSERPIRKSRRSFLPQDPF